MAERRIALEKVAFLPPTRVTDDVSVLTLRSMVLEPLLTWRNGRVGPGLFDRWTSSREGRCWRFHLRPGAMFHDGRPCEIGDVLSFLDAILEARDTFGMKWAYSRYFANTRFTAGPGNSLVAEDPDPIAHIQDVFCEFHLSRPDEAGRPVIGTGPFRVVETGEGTAVLESVLDHGDRLVLEAEPRAELRLLALRSGRVDAAMNLEHVSDRPDQDSGLDWLRATSTLSVMAYLNCTRAPFDDVRMRSAVNLAVDRATIVRDVFHGLAEPAASVVSPFHLGMQEPLSAVPYAPERARKLLDEAGGPDAIILRTPTFMPERAPLLAAAIARDLEREGWRVIVDEEPDRPEYARQIGRKEMGDIALFDSSPNSTFRVLNDKISSRVRGTWWQGYDDPVAERLMSAAFHHVAPTDREAAYRACLHHLAGNPPWLYLVHPILVAGVRPGTAGFALDNRGVLSVA